MSTAGSYVGATFSLLQVAGVLVALWLALRFEPRIAPHLEGDGRQPLRKGMRTILWFALGSVLSLALLDLVGFLRMIVQIISPVSWGLAEGTVPTIWGNPPARVFDALSAGTTLTVYAIVWSFLWPHLRDRPSPFLASLAPSAIDRLLVTLSGGGLVNLIVTSAVIGIVLTQTPTFVGPFQAGTAGFIGGWLLGLLIVAVVAGLYSLRVPSESREP